MIGEIGIKDQVLVLMVCRVNDSIAPFYLLDLHNIVNNLMLYFGAEIKS